MTEKIWKLILLILIAGFLLYVIHSGIIGKSLTGIHNIAFNGSSTSTGFLSGFVPPGNNPVLGSSGAGSGSGNGNGTDNGNGSGNGLSNITPSEIPTGFTLSQLSPYFHEVRIGGTSYGGYGSYGEISLSAELTASNTVDITGWHLQGRDSGEYIPQAIDLYDPSGLTAPSNIVLHQNDDVTLYSSSGPFNLRLNECIGYISSDVNFTPPLPDNCPPINYSQVQNFTGACQEYIESIGGCEQPNLADPRVPLNDDACRNYLADNFNYKSCFTAHVGDANFLSNQIWVWTGANIVDQYHDQIELLDRNGLLVDLYSY